MDEARHHPHNIARETFVNDSDVWQPAPVPRFSRTVVNAGSTAVALGENSQTILLSLGYGQEEIDALLATGAIA
jgi:alpha-methylacyl-CoA racemase